MRIRRERDFYRRLVELGTNTEVGALLEEALGLIVEIAGARRGYIEIRGLGDAEAPRFWIAAGCYDEQVEEIRESFSSGVIAAAIATGRTILTDSALKDPRFLKRGSVKRNRTEAVICAPIGTSPPLGVVYLQDRTQAGPFSESDQLHVEQLAGHVATLADRLLLQKKARDDSDLTAPHRKTLSVLGLIGRSHALARALERVEAVAAHDVGVLLTGPNGSGKTQIAQILHDNSPRRKGPFLELNCAALPEALVENEIFGAVKGAHAGVITAPSQGKVAAAEGGTLFLDEIGDMPVSVQAKLLQLLQSKTYFPLGGTKPLRADIRVISATNRDLDEAIAKKTFREDLYYRIRGMEIRVPSLAERREDIALLADHFCDSAVERYKLPTLRLTPRARLALEHADWPGNVRQLANTVESGVLLAHRDKTLDVEVRHLFPDNMSVPEAKIGFQDATRRFQERLLRQVLKDVDWNVTEAAERLQLTRSHVYNLIHAFGVNKPPR